MNQRLGVVLEAAAGRDETVSKYPNVGPQRGNTHKGIDDQRLGLALEAAAGRDGPRSVANEVSTHYESRPIRNFYHT